jgi:hypothetical protein
MLNSPTPTHPPPDPDPDTPTLSVRQKRALGTPLTPLARSDWSFDADQSESVSAADQAVIHAIVLERYD